jgi:hypothetical protein
LDHALGHERVFIICVFPDTGTDFCLGDLIKQVAFCGAEIGLAAERNFHPIWGAAAPPLDFVRILLVSAAVGLFGGAVATSSLVGEQSSQSLRNISVSDKRVPVVRQSPLAHSVPTETIKTQSPGSGQSQGQNNAPAPAARSSNGSSQTVEAQTADSPRCNIASCEPAYQSFRESDCTYQPHAGPRRYCAR